MYCCTTFFFYQVLSSASTHRIQVAGGAKANPTKYEANHNEYEIIFIEMINFRRMFSSQGQQTMKSLLTHRSTLYFKPTIK